MTFVFHNTANLQFTFKERTVIEQVSLAVSLYTRIREALLSSLGCTPVILINFLRTFPLLPQANFGTVPALGDDRSLPNVFHFFIH